MGTLPPAPRDLDPKAASHLIAASASAQFDGRVFRTLGIVGPPGWKNTMRGALTRLPTPACAVLTQFFIIGDALPAATIEPVLGGPDVLPALERAGLVIQEGDLWRCPFVVIPTPEVMAFSDPIDDPASASPPDDYIIPISGSTRFVHDLTVRVPCELAVDLGCGQGYLAVRCASHAKKCIATDIVPRALAFTRVNAALNGVGDRIETRLGSFFEPLAPEQGKIDLLTCNPPFIIQPGGNTTASVSKMAGDGMLEHLVRTAPTMIRDGGWITLIGMWENQNPDDWLARIRPWVEGSGCDCLALQFRIYRPDEYVAAWISPESRAQSEPAWRQLCEERRIASMTYGAIIMNKRRGLNWLRSAFTLINIRSGPASEQLRSYFFTQTALDTISSSTRILDRRVRSAPGWRYDPAAGLPRSAPPGASPGLALPLQNAAQIEPLLLSLDGSKTVRATLEQMQAAGRLPVTIEQAASTIHMLLKSGAAEFVA